MFIQTLQQECLDYFVVFGERHINYLVSEFVAHYHEERPHQGKENGLLMWDSSELRKKKPKNLFSNGQKVKDTLRLLD